MRHLLPGDNVELIPAPMDQAECEAEYEAHLRARPALDRRATPRWSWLKVAM